MTKDKFNSKLREYARTLSPQEKERDLIGKIYQSFNELLGVNDCIQIGSYPRQTATTPVHDLDILYVADDWHEDWPTDSFTPSEAIADLKSRLENEFECPDNCQVLSVDIQTHSVSVTLKCNSLEFSVDVVPAYTIGTNEFGDPTYRVPEVVKKKSHTDRVSFYTQKYNAYESVGWIDSDPRGYISVASQVGVNPDFRKAVKLVKRWKDNLEDEDEQLKLKSFHVEQVITQMFLANPDLQLFDAIYGFFVDMPDTVLIANQIEDHANAGVYIDDYIAKFTTAQIQKIKRARDGFLIKLENLRESDQASTLMSINFYTRPLSEEFLFDKKIKALIDSTLGLRIDGYVKPLQGFSSGWLTQTPQLQKGLTRGSGRARRIEFSIRHDSTSAETFWWKVRNSDSCNQPRGEMTPHQTKNNPESTEYVGDHHVECFAVIGDVCVARARVPVRII